MKSLHKIAYILVIIGGLNWGLHALGYNVVDMLPSQIAMIVYLLVGISAIYEVATHKQNCNNCVPSRTGGQM
jgi:uncharacterized membrane protein YuzA (DUF378 family)